MNLIEIHPSKSGPRADDLAQLQRRIAQRADELAYRRGRRRDPATDWECWLEAEREVFGRLDPAVDGN